MNAKDVRRHITALLTVWIALSAVTLCLYWALWWIVDPDGFMDEGISWYMFKFDSAYCASLTAVFMLVDLCFRSIFKRVLNNPIGFGSTALVMLALNVTLAVLIENAVERWVYGMEGEFVWTQGTLILGLIAAFLTLLAIIHRHYQLMTREQERNQQMEVQLLKKQLDPHFLFNNLSTVASTLDPDTQAYRTLQQLARVYRHVVTGLTRETIKVCESMPVITAYVDLIHLRAPGHFNITVDPAVATCTKLVLPLSLQMLIENAMKHNKHSEEHPIDISVAIDNDWMVVKNTYRPNDVTLHSAHQGLQNLGRRYRYLAKRDIRVIKSDLEFEVRLPLIDNIAKLDKK